MSCLNNIDFLMQTLFTTDSVYTYFYMLVEDTNILGDPASHHPT
jgi:hypothetical protein